ncbi:hypothetical protein [Actinoplanes sp. G11-F43]|uniref:hypothetical protein n=1 Tax=Actinoplanes sp. G11-F43 TaxID=3424130 RepID=UPI003D344CC0
MKKILPWAGAAAVLAAGVLTFAQAGSAAEATASPLSLVEDYSYPNAAQILAEQNVKLISGDGNILLVDCSTPAEGDIGLLKIWTTDETIGADGVGRVCFKILKAPGLLNLEVPGVYEIRGDGQRTGTGHEVTATIKPEGGTQKAVPVDADGSVQVGQGADPNDVPTTLLKIEAKG